MAAVHRPIATLRNKPPLPQEKPNRFRKKKYYAEEDCHRSIWKLVYADFMTAMMAFFLVMWLVNSAAKEKIVRLADYFQTIHFSDPTPFRRSVCYC